MIYGSVRVMAFGKPATFKLTDKGWVSSRRVLGSMADHLDFACSPSAFGPSDGDPIVLSINRAAELLGGKVTHAGLKPRSPSTKF
jgi:hypothetical protein